MLRFTFRCCEKNILNKGSLGRKKFASTCISSASVMEARARTEVDAEAETRGALLTGWLSLAHTSSAFPYNPDYLPRDGTALSELGLL